MSAVLLQFAPQICRFDAVGNAVFALDEVFKLLGLNSRIACQHSDLPLRRRLKPLRALLHSRSDVLFVHHSHGTGAPPSLLRKGGIKIFVYHGVTPPGFFRGTNRQLEEASRRGLDELNRSAEHFSHAVAHSGYTAQELTAAGFRNVTVLPYVLYEPLYAVSPDPSLLDRYGGDGWINLLTVGRVAPNKCLEDCIFIFDYFHRKIQRKSRLFIVGSWQGTEAYWQRLQELVCRLGTPEIFFTGHVTQAELLAFLRLADAYLCMSQHEGFGVPLVEAMRFGVPVFAYSAAAVPETLRGTGFLFPQKSWPVIAEAIGLVLADADLRARVSAEEQREAGYYSLEASLRRMRGFLTSLGILSPVAKEE